MIPHPDIDQLRYLTTATGSLFGLYSIVVGLIIQFERERKFMGLTFRLGVCVPIFLLAASFIAGIKTVYCSWLWNVVPQSGTYVLFGMTVADATAVAWIAIALLYLILKIGKSS
jgi:hypothetical protein